MPRYSLFNAFSDLAISGPGKIMPIQQLSKLIVVHGPEFKLSGSLIQGKSLYWIAGALETVIIVKNMFQLARSHLKTALERILWPSEQIFDNHDRMRNKI
jgi:hypothetical protein